VAPAEWNEVAAAAKSAADLMPDGAPHGLRERSRRLLDAIRAHRESAEADHRLLSGLAEARFAEQDLGPDGTDAAYVAALVGAGLDLDRLSTREVEARIRQQSRPVALELAAYLDGMAGVRRTLRRPPEPWQRPP